jgi:DNA-binding cell septation regulator SpoVG
MVTVESIKPLTNAGSLRAFATVLIAGKLRICNCRIIQQAGETAWVSLPARAYEKDGKRLWASIVEILDEKLKRQVTDAILAEFGKMSKAAAPEGWQ